MVFFGVREAYTGKTNCDLPRVPRCNAPTSPSLDRPSTSCPGRDRKGTLPLLSSLGGEERNPNQTRQRRARARPSTASCPPLRQSPRGTPHAHPVKPPRSHPLSAARGTSRRQERRPRFRSLDDLNDVLQLLPKRKKNWRPILIAAQGEFRGSDPNSTHGRRRRWWR